MGKNKKLHRKKVQARNARIAAAHKKLGKDLRAEFEKQKQEQSLQEAIAKNYEIIHGQLPENQKQELLEQSGVRFS